MTQQSDIAPPSGRKKRLSIYLDPNLSHRLADHAGRREQSRSMIAEDVQPNRLDAAKALAKKMGCEMHEFYMTVGAYDMVVMAEAPNDETFAKFSLNLAMGGNIRTTTLKAFPEDAYRKIIGGL